MTTPGRLPVAERADVRRSVAQLVRADRRAFALVLGLNALAALAGLAGPWLLGRIVDEVRAGSGVGAVDRMALAILLCSLAQLLLARWARYVGHRFGERTLARVRERFVDRALALPASVVERAGTGDLTTRGTADVTTVGTTLRDAGPELLINSVQALFLTGAVFVLDPLLGAVGVLGLTPVWFALRWYLRRARAGYLAEGAATSDVAESLAATVAGARTVEAFGLTGRRRRDEPGGAGGLAAHPVPHAVPAQRVLPGGGDLVRRPGGGRAAARRCPARARVGEPRGGGGLRRVPPAAGRAARRGTDADRAAPGGRRLVLPGGGAGARSAGDGGRLAGPGGRPYRRGRGAVRLRPGRRGAARGGPDRAAG